MNAVVSSSNNLPQSKYLLIDSKYRTSGSSNNFIFTFTDNIIINQAIKLVYSSIPNSSYLFNSSNNSFNVSYNSSSESTITFPIGSLRTDEIAMSIQSQFLALYPSSNFTCQFNQHTINFNTNASNPYYFNFPNNSIASILGFNIGINNSSANNLNSLYIINTIYPDYIHMYIDKIFNQNILSSQNLLSSFMIPMNADRSIMNVINELATFENTVFTQSQIKFNSFNVRLLNPDQTPFLNNNCDWSCLFQYS